MQKVLSYTLFEKLSVQFIYSGIPNFYNVNSIDQILMPKPPNEDGKLKHTTSGFFSQFQGDFFHIVFYTKNGLKV